MLEHLEVVKCFVRCKLLILLITLNKCIILKVVNMTYMKAVQLSSSIQEMFSEHLLCTITQDNFMMKMNHGRGRRK